ncbi:MAG TPA: hypothetical protein PLP55_01780 [Phycicoccus elongatus]|uniref:hypothetical protein n=1 Tax=Phycicoccus TaxID=367298 RepID=UPI001D7CF743|nr:MULTISPECIES: hypothetical protein [Phycicoccus]MCB1240233.1 hypothetical protein [Tetrasphaera sp.]MCB9407074.1 hypothetical protein [Tetrasphaera sp.]MCO5303216.1 hypothetical protein [Phycicoccus sp.]HPK11393.1 hypothetical protein [Phycicoccus elongatus]HPQ72433.1 hypothetical protein [Phycicoccus elongatus]
MPFETRDLNVVAATLAAAEIGSAHTHHVGWVAKYAPDQETVGYLDHVIPGPTSIMDLRGSLGRCLQHTLLRYEDGHQWPHLEKWELDWAVADPVGYQDRRVPTWLRENLSLTEPLPDLDHRRAKLSGISAETRT